MSWKEKILSVVVWLLALYGLARLFVDLIGPVQRAH